MELKDSLKSIRAGVDLNSSAAFQVVDILKNIELTFPPYRRCDGVRVL